MTITTLNSIFNTIASKHKKLHPNQGPAHFFRGEAEEFINGFRSKVAFPALILESPITEFSVTAIGMNESATIAYMVVGTHTRDDWKERSTVINECQVIGRDVIAYIVQNQLGILPKDIHEEVIINAALKYAGVRYEMNCEGGYIQNCLTNFNA